MAQTSLYDVLLVDQNATLEEIKLAFKRRALQVHPDKGGSKEEFHLVYQALETLGDPAARQKYDHSLATTKTGPASHATHAPHPKSRKRKREEKHAQQAASCKAKTETKPTVPGKKSTTFAGKAPSKPRQAAATSAEPQSKQTKLLMKIRDLLKQLPRDARNDVITNQFSQKQRLILEKWMADNAATPSSSSGTKCHSEAKALAPAAGKSATNRREDPSHESLSVALPSTNITNSFEVMAKSMEKKRKSTERSSCDAICISPRQVSTSRMQASDTKSLPCAVDETCSAPHPTGMKEMEPVRDLTIGEVGRASATELGRTKMAKRSAKVKDNKKASIARMHGSSGYLQTPHNRSSYMARICFDSFEMRTGYYCDLKTALEDLMILTSVKQKMRNHKGAGTFAENLQAALASSATEHGRNLADLKLWFAVFQHAGFFIVSGLRTPSVRSPEVFGKMRSVLEPFRQYSNQVGVRSSLYWRYSPVHLEDAWERFQSAVAEAWEIAGVDSTSILQKIRARHEAQASLHRASLQHWEQQNMARQDKNRHRPKRLRERNPTAALECWERRQMALEDKNKHRPSHLRERNPAATLEYWERRQMAMQDKDKHRPKKLRQKLQLGKFASESPVTRRLTALRKLIARWGRMLKKDAKLVEEERQKVLRQRKAQQKKDQEEQRRVEVLKQKQQREEERSRRELLRKRMRSDLTMDDILGQKGARQHPDTKFPIIHILNFWGV